MSGVFRTLDMNSRWLRYLVAVAASLVAALLTIAIRSETNLAYIVTPLLAAILLTGWYAGTGPAIVALILAMIIDRTAPMLSGQPHEWAFGTQHVWFILFAIGAAQLGAERRRANEALHGANERLERDVALRTKELRRKEWYLEEAERLSHTGSWTIDLGSESIGFWSDETFRIFGIPPGPIVPGEGYLKKFVHPKDLPYALAARRAAIQERRSWDLRHRIVRPDGDVRYIHTVGQPYFDEQGRLVAYIGCVMDVTEQRRMARALRRNRERSMRLRFQAQLAERNRIAREMHDTLLQGFTGVALKLVATASSLSESQRDSEALHEVIGLAQRTLEEARRSISDIRAPLSSSNLPEALRMEAEEATRGSEVNVQLEVTGEVRPLPLSIVAVVLRVAREAVSNVVRHSDADAVRLHLRYGRRAIGLTVTDRGRGFVVDAKLGAYVGHFGLLGMRERASEAGGRLLIESEPGHGTSVRLRVPVPSRRSVVREAADLSPRDEIYGQHGNKPQVDSSPSA